MSQLKGVYKTKRKDGSVYYRASITYKMKHISLGSYDVEADANAAYYEARATLDDIDCTIDSYDKKMKIPFQKFIALINFRDNGLYLATPIYLKQRYFEYHLDENTVLKFDRDDLFFLASHTILRRGGYFYYNDYGSQYKLLTRYGIRPFAVYGRDYIMINGDIYDYRYSNIRILNHYIGVLCDKDNVSNTYTSLIHINGNYIIGRYDNEIDAAIAYNKAVDTLWANGFTKGYSKNYISELTKEEYLKRYSSIRISDSIISAHP